MKTDYWLFTNSRHIQLTSTLQEKQKRIKFVFFNMPHPYKLGKVKTEHVWLDTVRRESVFQVMP